MVKLITNLHLSFFENDNDNLVATGMGFTISAVCIVAFWLLY